MRPRGKAPRLVPQGAPRCRGLQPAVQHPWRPRQDPWRHLLRRWLSQWWLLPRPAAQPRTVAGHPPGLPSHGCRTCASQHRRVFVSKAWVPSCSTHSCAAPQHKLARVLGNGTQTRLGGQVWCFGEHPTARPWTPTHLGTTATGESVVPGSKPRVMDCICCWESDDQADVWAGGQCPGTNTRASREKGGTAGVRTDGI